jgi:two-component system, cell cycle response regulator
MSLPRQIVLVDLDARRATTLAERLRMQGYLVRVANDAAEGAKMALAEPPHAVIAELWMPSISGVQLCRLLGAQPATENVPVILRGPESGRNRFWAESAGAAAFVATGRMGDLVRELARAVSDQPDEVGFFTSFPSTGHDIRDHIAQHLDAALFESVITGEGMSPVMSHHGSAHRRLE